MRLIDADEIRIKPEYMHDICGSVMIRVEDVARIINEMPTINPQPQWIPCNEITGEGFPKEDGNYYITEQNYGYYLESDEKQCVAHLSPFRRGDFTNRFYDANYSNIVAWMSLPEPYEKKE